MRSAATVAVFACLLTSSTAYGHAGALPAVAVLASPGCFVDQPDDDGLFTIRWNDTDDCTEASTIDFFYTPVRPPTFRPWEISTQLTGVLIAGDILESDKANELVWDTSGLSPGMYWIYTRTTDLGTELTMFSRGVVAVTGGVQPGPAISLVQAPFPQDVTVNTAYLVRYASFDPAGDGRVTLEITQDVDGNDLQVLADDLPGGPTGSFLWDTTDTAEGEWLVRATIRDQQGRSHSAFGDRFVRVLHWDQLPVVDEDPDVLPDGVNVEEGRVCLEAFNPLGPDAGGPTPGCDGDVGVVDAGSTDAGPEPSDSGSLDVGPDEDDASIERDAGDVDDRPDLGLDAGPTEPVPDAARRHGRGTAGRRFRWRRRRVRLPGVILGARSPLVASTPLMRPFLLLVLGVSAASCGEDADAVSPECLAELPADCAPLFEPTFDNLHARTLGPVCAQPSCHAGPSPRAGLTLQEADAAYAALTSGAEPLTGLAAAPACAPLLTRVLSDVPAVVMPPGAALPDAEACAVVQWVLAGSPR